MRIHLADVRFLQNVGALDPADGDFGFAAFLASINVPITGRASFDKVVSFGKDQWAYGDMPVLVCTRNPATVTIPEHLQKIISCSSLSPEEIYKKLQLGGYEHAYIEGGVTI